MLQKGIKVGIIVVLTGLLIYYGYPFLTGDTRSPKSHYYLLLSDVSGLVASSPVRVNGYKVGKVEDIRLLRQEGYKILVELSIEKSIPIGRESRLIMTTDGLLGERFIALSLRESNEIYLPGDTLSGYTVGGTSFEHIQERALSILDDLKKTSTTLNKTLEGARDVESSVIQVAEKTEQIIDKVYKVLKEGEGDINKTFRSLGEFSESIARTSELVERIVDSSLAKDVAETIVTFKSAADKMEHMLQEMEKGQGTMGKLLTDEELYVELRRTLDNLNTLLTHFNKSPKDFMSPLGRSSKQIMKREQRAKERARPEGER